MRDGWNRAAAVLDLSAEVVEALVCKAIPGAKVVRFQTVEGLANTKNNAFWFCEKCLSVYN